ncbi:MAG: hypothetical protein NVS9B10_13430 [Nevskia sp.]
MKTKHLMLLALAATLPLAACNNGGSPAAGSTTPAPPGPASLPLVSLVNQLFAATNETGSPVEINTLPIDASDDNPGLYTGLVI